MCVSIYTFLYFSKAQRDRTKGVTDVGTARSLRVASLETKGKFNWVERNFCENNLKCRYFASSCFQ